MADIRIKIRNYEAKVMGISEEGRRWLRVNRGEVSFDIEKDIVDEFRAEIERDGLTVDVAN